MALYWHVLTNNGLELLSNFDTVNMHFWATA